jgi:glutamate N-acetyltransferase / amino-acid N-acetyltransferase
MTELSDASTGITAPKGFRATGVAAGLKSSGLLDVALIVNDGPTRAGAGVFTANRVKAAPVLWTQQVVRDGRVDAVVLNSGGANACTGPQGFQDTHATAEWAAMALGVSAADVAICSTGLIGDRLPMNELLAGVDAAVPLLSDEGGDEAARAIMTTDSVPKQAVHVGDGFSVGGMAKGAGMLAPGLATMLAVVTTDAEVEPAVLDRVLRAATARTFDRVDSDGCMSTNDTVLLLASGASGVAPTEDDLARAVHAVCADLSRQLVDDAEGASKTIAVEVIRAASEADATAVGRAVARSNLLKCAINGEDPNWGRVLAAVGTTDATFEPERLAVSLGGVWVCRDGAAAEDRTKVDLSGRLVTIVIDLAAGDDEATVWTNDLTAAYVHENSAYST